MKGAGPIQRGIDGGKTADRVKRRSAVSGRGEVPNYRPAPLPTDRSTNRRLYQPKALARHSCAGSGSIVSGSTGTWTSSRYGDVITVTPHAREGIHELDVAQAPEAEVERDATPISQMPNGCGAPAVGATDRPRCSACSQSAHQAARGEQDVRGQVHLGGPRRSGRRTAATNMSQMRRQRDDLPRVRSSRRRMKNASPRPCCRTRSRGTARRSGSPRTR